MAKFKKKISEKERPSTKEKDHIEMTGIIIDTLPNATFRVKLNSFKTAASEEKKTEYIVLAYISGKLRKNYIRILQGDYVLVEISPYDLTRARIIKRLDERDAAKKNDSTLSA